MEQLLNLGADGYFIKPSPELETTPQVLKNELEAFIELIKSSHEKYRELSLFWKYIKIINDDNNSTLIEERGNTQVEKRIKERLMMFFGLLKRDYEDSNFNEKFYYSDIELAFMTLWSCLNDIQFIYYEKTVAWTTSSGRENFEIKVEDYLLSKQAITTSNDLESFLQRKRTGNSFETLLKVDYNLSNNIYTILNSPINGKNYQTNIGEQIAFLLLTLDKGNTSNSTESIATINQLLGNLVNLKNKRNNLYLTHGDETGDFFEKTEKEKQDITLKDCAELFEIVYFLLKAEYISINA